MTIWKYKLEFTRWRIYVSKRWDDKELAKGGWTTTEQELENAIRLDDELGL